jgi:hypothetical protein
MQISHAAASNRMTRTTSRAAGTGTGTGTGTRMLGESTIGPLADSQPAGEAEAFSFAAAKTGTVQTLSLYVDTRSRAKTLGIALYADAGERPGSLLTRGSRSGPQSGAWNIVSVAPAPVTSGHRYWIAVLGNGGALMFRDRASSSCRSESSARTSLSAFPATWTSGNVWSTCLLSAYASGTASSIPPTTQPTLPPPPPVPTPVPAPPPSPTPAPPPPSADCTVNATTGTFGAVFSAAGSGAVICLASGDYGSFAGSTKPGPVAIKPAAGASPSIQIAFGPTAKNIRIDGFRDFRGWDLNGSQNIEIVNTVFTGPMQVRGAVSGILFDNDTFDRLGHATWEGRLSFAQGASNAIVRNSHFGNGGCSDGIQLTGESTGVTIQGNVFSGLRQGACAEHADPIQFYGTSNVKILDNYFYDNSTGIMTPDGNGSPSVIQNNVWVMDEYPWAIASGRDRDSQISHNVVIGGWLRFQDSQGTAIRDNVSDVSFAGTTPLIDHNVLPSAVSFRGGAGRCAYALKLTSEGRGGGSDGTDVGLNDCP